MKAYLLYDNRAKQLYMAFGEDPVEASKGLPCHEDDVSVSGSWDVASGTAINLYKKTWTYWPYGHLKADG